jgi:hypothetical protein
MTFEPKLKARLKRNLSWKHRWNSISSGFPPGPRKRLATGRRPGPYKTAPRHPNKADREYVEAVNKRWTGIKETHFHRCALRARENDLPGVTVLAVGAVRAEIVLQCLKLGTINHLILDTDCADELQGLAR